MEDNASKKTDHTHNDEFADKLQEKLFEYARLKRNANHRRDHPSQEKTVSDNIDDNSPYPDTNSAADERPEPEIPARKNAEPEHTEVTPQADHPTPAPEPVTKQNVTMASPSVATSMPASADPGRKNTAPIIIVGGLIILVIFINGWYLASRIEANKQSQGNATRETAEALAESGIITSMLEQANQALDAGALIAPVGNSAVDLYRAVLRLDPDNQQATAGIRAVTDHLLFNAEAALKAQQFDEANTALLAVRDIDSELPLLDLLEAQIARQQSTPSTQSAEPIQQSNMTATPVEKSTRSSHEKSAEQRVTTDTNTNTVDKTAVKPSPKVAITQSATVDDTSPVEVSGKETIQDSSSKKTAPQTTTENPEAKGPVRVPPVVPVIAPSNQTSTQPLATPAAIKTTDTKPPQPTVSNASTEIADEATESANTTFSETTSTLQQQTDTAALANSTPEQTTTQAIEADSQPNKKQADKTDQPVPLVRVKRVAPVAPTIAIRRGLSGWVDVAFTVSKGGDTTDVEVTDSEPPGIFDSAAIDAVQQWQFEPPIRDGEPVSQQTKVRFKFVLPK